MIVLSVDPGRRKCGLAVVSSDKGTLKHKVVPLDELIPCCQEVLNEFAIDFVTVGGSTGSDNVRKMLESIGLKVIIVDESHSTERARGRFFADHPPSGWKKILPIGLQTPPQSYDDYAAVIMAEDFISKRLKDEEHL